MRQLGPIGESSTTVVAATFGRRGQAQAALSLLRRRAAVAGRMELLEPWEAGVDRKFESDDDGILRTAIRSHLLFGALGPVLGLLLAAILVGLQWPPAVGSPLHAAVFFTFLGGFLGIVVAGLCTLRPDHAAVIEAVRERLGDGDWAVVVRPTDAVSARRATASLADSGGVARRSL